jgi:hypothetical protein
MQGISSLDEQLLASYEELYSTTEPTTNMHITLKVSYTLHCPYNKSGFNFSELQSLKFNLKKYIGFVKLI